jgi:GTP-binding protein
MFVEPGEPVYEGQIVAENARDNDMPVNPTTAKKLSNMRTTGSDENIILKPARKMTLEQALEYIEEDELVEATPQSIRLRKKHLTETARKKAGKSKAVETVEV